MKTDEDFSELSNELSLLEGETITINKAEYLAETSHAGESMSIVAKIFLSIGLLLGSAAVIGLFVISFQIFAGEMTSMFIGICMTALGVYLNRNHKSFALYLLGSISFVAGFIFINFGITSTTNESHIHYPINILLALVTVFLVRSFLLSLFAFNIIIYCMLLWLFHGINASSEMVAIPLFLLAIYLLRTFEKTIYSKAPDWVERIDALTVSLFVCTLISTIYNPIFYQKMGVEFHYLNIYLFIASTAVCLLTAYNALTRHLVPAKLKYAVIGALLLLCMVLLNAPYVLTAFSLLLLSFATNYRSGLILSTLALVYALFIYYYDMQFTLLMKSILLMGSGALFLASYHFINKYLWTKNDV